MPPGAFAAILILIAAVIFAAFCLDDLARREAVRYLPKMAWAVIICLTIPLGGVAYLLFGRTT